MTSTIYAELYLLMQPDDLVPGAPTEPSQPRFTDNPFFFFFFSQRSLHARRQIDRFNVKRKRNKVKATQSLSKFLAAVSDDLTAYITETKKNPERCCLNSGIRSQLSSLLSKLLHWGSDYNV